MDESSNIDIKIKIGGTFYRVEVVKTLKDENGQDLLGQSDPVACEIKVVGNLSAQAKLQTLWREVLHLILIHAGQPGIKEQALDALAYGIMATLQDNPVLRWGE